MPLNWTRGAMFLFESNMQNQTHKKPNVDGVNLNRFSMHLHFCSIGDLYKLYHSCLCWTFVCHVNLCQVEDSPDQKNRKRIYIYIYIHQTSDMRNLKYVVWCPSTGRLHQNDSGMTNIISFMCEPFVNISDWICKKRNKPTNVDKIFRTGIWIFQDLQRASMKTRCWTTEKRDHSKCWKHTDTVWIFFPVKSWGFKENWLNIFLYSFFNKGNPFA